MEVVLLRGILDGGHGVATGENECRDDCCGRRTVAVSHRGQAGTWFSKSAKFSAALGSVAAGLLEGTPTAGERGGLSPPSPPSEIFGRGWTFGFGGRRGRASWPVYAPDGQASPQRPRVLTAKPRTWRVPTCNPVCGAGRKRKRGRRLKSPLTCPHESAAGGGRE